MPKATKHTTKTASSPAIAKSSSQNSTANARTNASRAPAKTSKQVLSKAKIPVKTASKQISKGSKETKPSAFGKSKPKPEVSNPPKKPTTSYIFFSVQMAGQMKTMEKFKNLTFSEKAKIVSESWGKLTVKQKQQYVDLADQDKERYQKECKVFDKKGYFTNKDGEDSRSYFKPPKEVKKVEKAEETDDDEDEEMKEVESKKKPAKVEKEEEDPNIIKPKKPMTAFIYFSMENRFKVIKEQPDLKIGDVGRQNGLDWKKLTDAEKKKYFDMQEKDKLRYEKETMQFNEFGYFINSEGIKSTFLTKKGKVQEFEIGTIMPKKVQSSYMCYHKEAFPIAKKQCTDEKFDLIKITKQLGSQWNALSMIHKEKYEKQSQKDQGRYNDQLAQIRKNGYFLNEDGVKSTDIIQKQKRTKKAN